MRPCRTTRSEADRWDAAPTGRCSTADRRPAPPRDAATGDKVRFVLRGDRPDADHRSGWWCCCSSSTRCGSPTLRRPQRRRGAQRARAGRGATATTRPARRCRAAVPDASRSAPASPTSTCRGSAATTRFTIVEGTEPRRQLEKGPGHYRGTALPGQVGNFAVAGHRVGKGEPFLNLDQLRAGDAVIVETKYVLVRLPGARATRRPGDLQHDPATDGRSSRAARSSTRPTARCCCPVPDHPGVDADRRG